jgi:hypothetical protein
MLPGRPNHAVLAFIRIHGASNPEISRVIRRKSGRNGESIHNNNVVTTRFIGLIHTIHTPYYYYDYGDLACSYGKPVQPMGSTAWVLS